MLCRLPSATDILSHLIAMKQADPARLAIDIPLADAGYDEPGIDRLTLEIEDWWDVELPPGTVTSASSLVEIATLIAFHASR